MWPLFLGFRVQTLWLVDFTKNLSIKGSEVQKQWPDELLWMLWFDEKSISNVHISGYILWHYVDCWKCQEYFHSFVFLPSQDQKEERDIVCGGMHGDIYLQHQPICTSLGRWIITFHLATPQKTLNAIIGEKNGCHYGMVWS